MKQVNATNIETFGLHVMFDGYNCDQKRLDSKEYITQVLNELTNAIDMTQLSKPQVVYATGNNHHDPGGWSGVVIIEESHITVHTFVKRKFVTADVYSCRQFDTKIAVDYLKKAFSTNDVDVFIQKRGLRYPKENLL